MLRLLDNAALCFLLVSYSFTWWNILPPLWLLGLSVIGCIVLTFYDNYSHTLLFVLLTFIWSSSVGYSYIRWQLPERFFDTSLLIQAEVLDVSVLNIQAESKHAAQRINSNTQLSHQTTLENFAGYRPISVTLRISKTGIFDSYWQPKVRLSWLQPTFRLKQGNKVKLLVNLKRPVGLANPDGFNFQKWLLGKNIVAIGSIKSSVSNTLISDKISTRQRLSDSISQMDLTQKASILALSLGIKSSFSTNDWQLIQHSGTAHLFAISGLHLGIVGMFVMWTLKPVIPLLMLFVGKCRPNHFHIITLRLRLVLSCVVVSGYAFLAGFELPVTRALLAFTIYALVLYLGINWRGSALIIPTLVLFLVIMPLSMFTISFWFSFAAVAMIWLIVWSTNAQNLRVDSLEQNKLYSVCLIFFKKSITAIKLQLGLFIFTLPLVVYHFNAIASLSFFANLIAVPIICFLVVPFCLIATILLLIKLDQLALGLFEIANSLLTWVMEYLHSLLAFEFAVIQMPKVSLLAVIFALIATALCYLPYWPNRKLVVALLCLPWIKDLALATKHSNELHVLDVGHGLAIVLHIDDTVIVYDTGAVYPSGFNMVQAAILPHLKAKSVNQIDHLVISHLDNDHSAGESILGEYVFVKNIHKPSTTCNSTHGQEAFATSATASYSIQVLWPIKPILNARNNQSCVLKLRFASNGLTILFTGDIEQAAENQLVTLHDSGAIDLQSDILIVPHHGSSSSSTEPFLNRVSPDMALVSSKANGRWQQPSEAVVQRYKTKNIDLYSTSQSGRLKVLLDKPSKVLRYRQDEANYWYNKVPVLIHEDHN